MPNRQLRDGLRKSPRIKDLSMEARWLYVCLLTCADDFGRYHADPDIVSGDCLPFDRHLHDTCRALVRQLSDVGMLQLYEVEGVEYLQITRWRERVRSKSSKYPDPPEAASSPIDGQASDTCPSHDRQLTALPRASITTSTTTSTTRDDAGAAAPPSDQQEAGGHDPGRVPAAGRRRMTVSPLALPIVEQLVAHVIASCGRAEVPAAEQALWQEQITAWLSEKRVDPTLAARVATWLVTHGERWLKVADARQFGWNFDAMHAAMKAPAPGGAPAPAGPAGEMVSW